MHRFLHDNIGWYRYWHHKVIYLPTYALLIGLTVLSAAVILLGATVSEEPLAAEGILKEFPFQGRLTNTNGTVVADADYDLTFKLYTTATGGTAVWTEAHTGVNDIPTVDGIFNTMLGSITSLGSIDFNSDTWWIGVTAEFDAEMTPRIRLGSTAFAFNSDKLDGVDSTGFLVLNGQVAGQTAYGGTLASNNLVLRSTSNATKGNILLVDDGGNVGVGTTTPGQKLTVSNLRGVPATTGTTQAGMFRITPTVADGGSATMDMGIYIGSGGGWLQVTDRTDLSIQNPLLLNPNGGNVGIGIGTPGPDLRLTVAAPDATTNQIRLRSSRSSIVSTNTIGGIDFMSNDANLTAPGTVVASVQALAEADHTASVLTTGLAFKVTSGLTTSEAMRISGSGNVGISTTSPLATLDVAPKNTTGASGISQGWLQVRGANYTDNATSASGTSGNFAFSAIGQSTLSATNASVTTTNAHTLYIAGAPLAGTNMTITQAWALNVQAGNSRFNGKLIVGGGGAQTTNFFVNGTNSGGSGILSGLLQVGAGTFTDTVTAASGTAGSFAFSGHQTPTLAATNASVTTTNAANLYIAAAPIAGTNMTITNAYALWVDAGNARFDGSVGIGTTGPDRSLDVLHASSPQLRLTQADGTVYADFQVDSAGSLFITPTGSRLAIGLSATATADTTVSIGRSASASGAESNAIGYGTIASNTRAIAIGYLSTASSINTIALGAGSLANTSSAIAIGTGSDALASLALALGSDSSASALRAISIGDVSTASAEAAIALGAGSDATAIGSMAIGYLSNASVLNSMALGREAVASATNAIGLGYLALADEANALVIGSNSGVINNIYFGAGRTSATASGSTYALNATGGSGTNIAGGALTIAGGRGTGTGVGGSIILQTAPAGASGSTLNSLVTQLVLTSIGDVGIQCAAPDNDLEVGGTGVGCNTGTRSFMNAGDTAWSNSSSRTIKENFNQVSGSSILERISAVPVYTYDFKPEFCTDHCANRMGLVAEDFHTVFGRGEATTINGHEITMALWLATQALNEKIEALEAAKAKSPEITKLVGTVELVDLRVAGKAEISGSLQVAKAATFENTILVKGDATLEGSLEVRQGLVLGRRSVDEPTYITSETGQAVEPDHITGDEVIIGVKNTEATRTLILQSQARAEGKILIIKDESGGAAINNVIIETDDEAKIDGQASQTVNTNYGSLRLYSDGTNWFSF